MGKGRDCLTYSAVRCEYMKYDRVPGCRLPDRQRRGRGACRHLVKDRMEQTGMRWRIAGARRFSAYEPSTSTMTGCMHFHADRIRTEQRKLYPYKGRLWRILNLRNLGDPEVATESFGATARGVPRWADLAGRPALVVRQPH